MSQDTFNGWNNWDTWNVSLWINSDESIYNSALHFMEKYTGDTAYRDFVIYAKLTRETPDGALYSSEKLDYLALNTMLKELHS